MKPVKKEDLQSRETGREYQNLYIEAEKLYNDEKYVEMVDKLEASLKALPEALRNCR